MTRVDDFTRRLEKLQGQRDEWIPPWLSVATKAEVQEWRNLFREEDVRMRRLVRQPMTDVEERAREVSEIRAPMLQFEARLRKKYGARMALTWAEQTAEAINRARNDLEYREREGLNQKGPYD